MTPIDLRGRAALLVAVLFLAAGCAAPETASAPPEAATSPSSSGGPDILPLLVSAEITKGPNRFLFSLTDRNNALIAAPDVKVHLKFYDVDSAEDVVVFEADSRFFWSIEGTAGLYSAKVDYPSAGRWGTRFEATFPDGATKVVRADYDVREAGTTPALGAKPPTIDTPTLADVGGDVKALTTDQTPEPRLYETSIGDALTAGKPFVVTFATPAFCRTQTCGPTLDAVKSVAADYPDLTFINVEPYKMALRDGSLQPVLDAQGQLQAAAWTEAWGLPTEPYTFVIAADGTVAAKFEGIMPPDELTAAIDAL